MGVIGRCALLGYDPWLQPGIDEPTETILLPSGWVESSNPYYGLASYAWAEIPHEQIIALAADQASEIARGFDQPDHRLRWFLRIGSHD